ncbi:MAG: hypothetical protein K2P79_08830, partial [Sphingomonas sp.]|nr:hypothetical protein [Sphingomonas sp.]
EKREVAIAKLSPAPVSPVRMAFEHDSDNADEAMELLGIAERLGRRPEDDHHPGRLRIATWATQAALSRPGRRKLDEKDLNEVKRCTIDADRLKWPRKTAR